MKEIRIISESEYRNDLEKGLNELAEKIALSGLPIATIARGTRLHWTTINNAANGLPVRFQAFRRIKYYLDNINSKNL